MNSFVDIFIEGVFIVGLGCLSIAGAFWLLTIVKKAEHKRDGLIEDD